jgi:hypothetical protein
MWSWIFFIWSFSSSRMSGRIQEATVSFAAQLEFAEGLALGVDSPSQGLLPRPIKSALEVSASAALRSIHTLPGQRHNSEVSTSRRARAKRSKRFRIRP